MIRRIITKVPSRYLQSPLIPSNSSRIIPNTYVLNNQSNLTLPHQNQWGSNITHDQNVYPIHQN